MKTIELVEVSPTELDDKFIRRGKGKDSTYTAIESGQVFKRYAKRSSLFLLRPREPENLSDPN